MDAASQILINALGGLIAGIILLVAGTLLNRRDSRQARKAENALEVLLADNKLMAQRMSALQDAYQRDHPKKPDHPEEPDLPAKKRNYPENESDQAITLDDLITAEEQQQRILHHLRSDLREMRAELQGRRNPIWQPGRILMIVGALLTIGSTIVGILLALGVLH
jgi:hypothetical protein